MHLATFGRNLPCPPGRNSSAVAGCNGILRQPLSKLPCDNLRLHGFVTAGGAFFHHLPPLLHSRLRFLEELAIGVSLQQGNKRLQGTAAIPNQTYFNRES
jgi:hypothetical protein